MEILAVQERLHSLGFDLGPAGADGIRGRMTNRAIRQFQGRAGLHATGQLNHQTMSALFPSESNLDVSADRFPWYELAQVEMGTRELAGKRHSPKIMGWAKRLGLWYPDDETPWCGLFVAHCVGTALPEEPLPGNVLGARNWLRFGREIDSPAVGSIVVFWRGQPDSWKGHVGFVAGYGRRYVDCLGGNQSNAVNIRRFRKNRVLGYRWPANYPFTRTEVASLGRVTGTDGNEV